MTRPPTKPHPVYLIGRWRPARCSRRWAALAIAINLGLAAGVAALFAALAPAPGLAHPVALAALAALSGLAFLGEVRLKTFARDGYVETGTFFNPGIVLAFAALVIAGPVEALIVWWIPEAISRIILRREPIASPGHIATVTGYAAALLAGNELLSLRAAAGGPVADLAILYAAGMAMQVGNFALTVLGFSPFYEGQRPKALFRSEYLDLLPAYLPALGLAVITVLLFPTLGVVALIPLGVAILLPQALLGRLVRERSAASLEPRAAAALYAAAIADVMGLSRRDRRVLRRAVELPRPRRGHGLEQISHELAALIAEVAASLRPGADVEEREALLVARRAGERFDGADWPDGLAALTPAPLPSRVLAVARDWAELTAAGTEQLRHADAIAALSRRAGAAVDGAVVRAAAQVVAEEAAFLRDPGFQPRLHRMPLPQPLRRRLGPALLRRLADTA